MERRFVMHRPRAAAPTKAPAEPAARSKPAADTPAETPKEIGGPSGPEPTRYGDWERNGICYDF